MPMVFVAVAAVVWAAPATWVVPVAQAALTTLRVEAVGGVNHIMAEPVAAWEPVWLLAAMPVVRGQS